MCLHGGLKLHIEVHHSLRLGHAVRSTTITGRLLSLLPKLGDVILQVAHKLTELLNCLLLVNDRLLCGLEFTLRLDGGRRGERGD